MVFASEPKNLVGICEKIMPFPAGHYYAQGSFHCYRDMSAGSCLYAAGIWRSPVHRSTIFLCEGVRKRLDADAPLGFLLSGGLDSSLVCAISARC